MYGHDGKATNVTMVPGKSSLIIRNILALHWSDSILLYKFLHLGDMVLYESHSVLHGMCD